MKLRDNKGSITVFVLVGLLFMSAFLLISYANNVNKSKIAKEQFNMISNGIYSYNDGDANAYKRAYTVLRKGTKQTLSASVENSSNLELTKTFDDNLGSLRIYGNSVQDTTNGDPSPTNPVEIQSVGERTKNLFNKATATLGKNLNADTGGLYTSTARCVSDYIEVDASKQYTFVYNPDFTVGRYLTCYDENKTFLGLMYNRISGTSNTKMTIEFTDSSVKYIRANCFWNEDGTASEIDDFMILEGDTFESYEPYGKYKIPVKVSGKNLLSTMSTYPTVENNANEIFVKSGQTLTLSFKENTYNQWRWMIYVTEIDGTDVTTNPFSMGYLATAGRIQRGINANGNVSETFTANRDCIIKAVVFWNANNETGKQYSGYQLELNNSATTYEPYVGPQIVNIYLDEPLRKVGDYADYIDFENQTVVRKIQEVVFNGSEDWNKFSTYNNYYTIDTDNKYKFDTNIYCLSDKYKGQISAGGTAYNSGNMWVQSTSTYPRIYFADDNYTSAALFRQSLVENPVKACLVLATTADPQPIEIPKLKSYEDYTNIEVLTEIAPSKIEATYEGYTLE